MTTLEEKERLLAQLQAEVQSERAKLKHAEINEQLNYRLNELNKNHERVKSVFPEMEISTPSIDLTKKNAKCFFDADVEDYYKRVEVALSRYVSAMVSELYVVWNFDCVVNVCGNKRGIEHVFNLDKVRVSIQYETPIYDIVKRLKHKNHTIEVKKETFVRNSYSDAELLQTVEFTIKIEELPEFVKSVVKNLPSLIDINKDDHTLG